MDDYGVENNEPFDNLVEKFSVLHLYLFRKVVLGLILVNMSAIRAVSKSLGFDVSMEVSDRDVWNWEIREKIPVYHAQVERKR